MEGVTMGMNYGLRRLADWREGQTDPSNRWRGEFQPVAQIMADIFNAEVVTLAVGEGAAYGAASGDVVCGQKRGEKVSISDLSDRFVNSTPVKRPTTA